MDDEATAKDRERAAKDAMAEWLAFVAHLDAFHLSVYASTAAISTAVMIQSVGTDAAALSRAPDLKMAIELFAGAIPMSVFGYVAEARYGRDRLHPFARRWFCFSTAAMFVTGIFYMIKSINRNAAFAALAMIPMCLGWLMVAIKAKDRAPARVPSGLMPADEAPSNPPRPQDRSNSHNRISE